VRTLYGPLGKLDAQVVAGVFDELAAAARQQIARDGIDEGTVTFTFLADLRYVGQEHTIAIPVADHKLLSGDFEPLRKLFDTEHDQRYGQAAPDERLECVNVRLVVTAGKTDTLAEQWLAEPWVPEAPAPEGVRDVIFTDAARPVPTRVIWRPSLAAGARIEGPAVIEEPNATTLIHPGDVATVTAAGHLIIDVALDQAGTLQ
jgi:N-methylhydantoinase A